MKPHRFLQYAIFLLVLGCQAQQRKAAEAPRALQQILADFKNPSGRVLVAAHRGDWRNAPENSVAAIRSCFALGVDIVEVDVKKTKDGQLILMHDETLDRTTNGTGLVADWTLDSIKTLRLRNGLGRVTDEPIPTLEEALQLVKGNIMINLDKAYEYFTLVMPLLEKTGTTQQAIMKGSVSVAQLQKDFGPKWNQLLFMPVIKLDEATAAKQVQEYEAVLRPQAYEFIFATDTSKVIRSFKQLGKRGARVWVNSLWGSLCAGHDDDRAVTDPNASWGWLVQNGTTIVQTDRPIALVNFLQNQKQELMK
jgi:glycerophosphoryl diester phosphodiesterase